MKEPAYPPARAVAARIEATFARMLEAAGRSSHETLAPLPGAELIEAVIDAAFWASLRREEGRDPKISLALVPPEWGEHATFFEEPIPLAAERLARLAPAVLRPGIHVGVWPCGDELCVWGTARAVPFLCPVLEVVEPGLLVVKYRRGEGFGKFGNVAVLRGDEAKFVDERIAKLPDYPAVLTSLLSFDENMSLRDARGVLIQLALSMRSHGGGGILLVVPPENSTWRESLVWPTPYVVRRSASEIFDFMGRESKDEDPDVLPEAIRRAVDALAGLTAVDGATLVTSTFELLAFGVKIGRKKDSVPVSEVITTEPIEGNVPETVHPSQLGGTRHLAAAQFVYDQRDSLAMVASQDGRFTLFAWSPSQNVVRAHRVEWLLL